MKSETFHFSPTSAGVRIDHLNVHNANKNNNSDNNNCCNGTNNTNNNNNPASPLSRARILLNSSASITASQEEDEQRNFLDLEHILVGDHHLTAIKTEKNSLASSRRRHKPSHKMRNCLLVVGLAVIVTLLSFVFLVECRSIKSSPSYSKKNQDAEVQSESRIQDASFQDPDPESSEEYPTKVVATTFASKTTSSSSSPASSTTKTSSTTKRASRSSSTSSSGRLTRSRVSVICTGGQAGILDENLSSTSTSTSPSSRKSQSKQVNLPTLLPRVSDDNEEYENEGGETNDWDDEDETALNSEELKSQVVTVSGYSHVAGGKPETKALLKSGSHTAIQYVPKPSKTHASSTVHDDDDEEDEASDEDVVEIVSLKPKPATHGKANKPKAQRISVDKTQTESVASSRGTTTTRKSSTKKDKKSRQQQRQSERESQEDDEEVIAVTPQTSKRSSKHSSKKSSKQSNISNKNEKGDSGEIEEESLFPTLRQSNNKHKTSERRQKLPTIIQIVTETDPELESAEAEPEAIFSSPKRIISSNTRKSSRSRKSKNNSNSDLKREESSLKPVSVGAERSSSEEFNMEEMSFAPTTRESSRKGKSKKSSSTSTRSSRMNSRTATPKQRTGAFSSVEND